MSDADRHNAHRRARRANPRTWPYIALSTIKHRAKRDGLVCTITVHDIPVPPVCPVLGIPLVPGDKVKPNSPSVDRFDNTRGYIPGNVRVISHRANQLKSDATTDELEKILGYIKGTLTFS